jgi:hypothetical protein
MPGRANAAAPAGEGQEVFVFPVFALDPSESPGEITRHQEFLDDPADYRLVETELVLRSVRIERFVFREMFGHAAVQRDKLALTSRALIPSHPGKREQSE